MIPKRIWLSASWPNRGSGTDPKRAGKSLVDTIGKVPVNRVMKIAVRDKTTSRDSSDLTHPLHPPCGRPRPIRYPL